VELSEEVQSVVEPEVKSTTPLGWPAPLTVAVRVSGLPCKPGFGFAVSTTLLVAWFTTNCAVGDEDDAYPLLLAYAAETVCEPAERPVTVTVAVPLLSVALYVVLSTVNTTVPRGDSVLPETVALSVTDWP
jgi:hypothetical protein